MLTVEHRTDAARDRTDHNRVAHLERAILHERVRRDAGILVEARLDHDAMRQAVGVSLQILQIGDQQNHLQQLGDPGLLLG
jgi:hypothetical protein